MSDPATDATLLPCYDGWNLLDPPTSVCAACDASLDRLDSPLGLGYADTKVIEVHQIAQALATGAPCSPTIGDMVVVARLLDAVTQG